MCLDQYPLPSPRTAASSRIVVRHQEQRLLLEALRHIPIDLQIVLGPSSWEKATTSEVLGIPEGTVKSRVRRAREQLDAKLTELA